MIETIFQAIKTELLTLEDIKEVYAYPESNPKGYPYCYITWENNESEVLTNREDRVIITYRITMVQEKIEDLKGRKNAETTIRNRQWDLESLFRENNNLGINNVLRTQPVNAIKTYVDGRIVTETELRVQVLAEVNYK